MSLKDFTVKRPEPIKYIVYKKIKNAILFDQLGQGEILNERKLADMLSVSRTPVRQALELLLKDGWVFRDGKSVHIDFLYYEEFLEMLPVRLENEKLSIKMALPLITSRHLNVMEKKLNQLEKYAKAIQHRNWEIDKIKFLEMEKSFHLSFSEISGNKYLYRLLEEYMDRFLKLGMISLKCRDDSVITQKKLRELYDAIVRKDQDNVFLILENELSRGKKNAEAFLKKKSSNEMWINIPLKDSAKNV